jgi:hypothetical protein
VDRQGGICQARLSMTLCACSFAARMSSAYIR